ncbi:DUF4345 domain-containing protein [Antrihabitans cavernicola]|uniref:DUF4345 domain-containing protein n=1 Tax=Antrihabitans cavernicola TaxID=2495913 RepID=A0A5A7S4J8_9NOCA|nr:DUF4345 domain-containing protein [Spelaeibacter cavernicola]KAA0017380.1 DUF4345 domain-containing protein [Spelaeibacter cavernicola]
MRTAFRWWLVVFGLVCTAIGVVHLFFGVSTIIGGGSVNATVDSDLRFCFVLFAAYGLGFVWAAQDLDHRAGVVNLLGLLFFLGGLARLLAWLQTGTPNWFYVLMIPVELVIPVVNWSLLRSGPASVPQVADAPRIRQG